MTVEPTWFRSYQAFGDLWIKMDHGQNVTDYRRDLNLLDGLARVEYTADRPSEPQSVIGQCSAHARNAVLPVFPVIPTGVPIPPRGGYRDGVEESHDRANHCRVGARIQRPRGLAETEIFRLRFRSAQNDSRHARGHHGFSTSAHITRKTTRMGSDNYFVYMLANKSRTTLYTGMTNGLTKRVLQHRRGDTPGFTQKYNCNRLVYFESFATPSEAIAREKQLKRWSRAKKETLIRTKNPDFEDLSVSVLRLDSAPKTQWQELAKTPPGRSGPIRPT